MKLKLTLIPLLFLAIIMSNCSSDSVESIIETKETEKEGSEEETPIEEEEPEEEEPEVTLPPVCDNISQVAFPTIDTNTTPSENKCDVFLEENGIVVMEAENTKSDLNLWAFSNATLIGRKTWQSTIHETKEINDHKGTGYIHYTGTWLSWNDPEQVSPLEYTFEIKNEGIYRLYLRSFKKLNEEGDKHNDCFIRVEGLDGATFTPGEPNTCIEDYDSKNVLPETRTWLLKNNTKFYGASNVSWVNNMRLDTHNASTDVPHYNRPFAVYNFKANQTYKLIITGRSLGFYIDRILFVDLNKYKNNNNEINAISNTAAQSTCK